MVGYTVTAGSPCSRLYDTETDGRVCVKFVVDTTAQKG